MNAPRAPRAPHAPRATPVNRLARLAPIAIRLAACATALPATFLGLASGCSSDPSRGYAFASPYDRGIRTVSVPMFENRTFTPGLEVDITDAIIKHIQARTPWRVTSSDRADARLEGAIVSSTLRSMATSPTTGLVQEMSVELAVDFEFRDARTGKVLVARQGFRAMDTFVPTRASGQELVATGEVGAAQRMGQDIVAELRSDW